MKDVKEYIAKFPKDVAQILNTIRTIILDAAPGAVEGISYGMPAYKLNGRPLVYYAGYKNHIGLYATPSGHEAFASRLSQYKQGKGSVQFHLNEPMPYALIEEIVKFRVEENMFKK
ncbi:MAG: hypothetical protein CL868_09695 [Cytophagaceae bacterium]|nr:hypothetical protein [Cytophagaceae bacterium]|tara:strand:+ start:1960 stop:2307 length:348 start_codon:yes stop_codon:yes gene_type:complete